MELQSATTAYHIVCLFRSYIVRDKTTEVSWSFHWKLGEMSQLSAR